MPETGVGRRIRVENSGGGARAGRAAPPARPRAARRAARRSGPCGWTPSSRAARWRRGCRWRDDEHRASARGPRRGPPPSGAAGRGCGRRRPEPAEERLRPLPEDHGQDHGGHDDRRRDEEHRVVSVEPHDADVVPPDLAAGRRRPRGGRGRATGSAQAERGAPARRSTLANPGAAPRPCHLCVSDRDGLGIRRLGRRAHIRRRQANHRSARIASAADLTPAC